MPQAVPMLARIVRLTSVLRLRPVGQERPDEAVEFPRCRCPRPVIERTSALAMLIRRVALTKQFSMAHT